MATADAKASGGSQQLLRVGTSTDGVKKSDTAQGLNSGVERGMMVAAPLKGAECSHCRRATITNQTAAADA